MHHSNKHFEILCNISPFFLHNKILQNYKQQISLVSDVDPDRFFFKHNFDNLLHCIYILVSDDINTLDNQYLKYKDIKEDAISKCTVDKALQLKHIKVTKNNFNNFIFSCKVIDLTIFYALCVYNNFSVFLVIDNIAYKFGTSDNVRGFIYVHQQNDHNKTYFSTRKYFDLQKVFLVINPFKPILPISQIKISELKTICNDLHISLVFNNKPKLKKQLYDEISKKLSLHDIKFLS